MNKNLHNVADLERLEGLEQDNYWLRGRVQELEAEVERLNDHHSTWHSYCEAFGGKERPGVNPSGVSDEPLPRRGSRKEREDG